MKLLFFIASYFFITILNTPVKTISIECVYHTGDFSHSLKGPSNYYCSVKSMNLRSREDLIVQNITGSHLSNKIDDIVQAFQVSTGTSYYCLQGVEKYFKNLKAIAYESCHLKEIHKEDLKPFPKIVDLYLDNNDLEVIEEGLLDYNPELVLVYITGNKITQIHSNVFDHLSKLTHMYFNSNICVNKDATDTAASKALIQQIKSDSLCQNAEFFKIEGKLKVLENNIKPLNLTSFKEQLEKLKMEFKYSKYSKHSPFDDRLETLKSAVYAENCKNFNQTALIDESTQDENQPFGIEDFSSSDDKTKATDDSLADFQHKINALSAKVSSIADIVERLEDKLSKMFKTVNFKVTVDV